MVGKMSYIGEGTIKDMTVGVRYLNIAESRGSAEAKEFLNRIDHTRNNGKRWGNTNNLIEIEQLFTPDLLSRPPKENIVNRSVSEGPKQKKGLFGFLKR